MKYFKKHPAYLASVHFIGGVGIGILLARPMGSHPMRWAAVFIALAILGHLYAWAAGKN